jgi:signal transduction histidine kinase/DNA-binding response OmpR family regulator/TolA-binding protein
LRYSCLFFILSVQLTISSSATAQSTSSAFKNLYDSLKSSESKKEYPLAAAQAIRLLDMMPADDLDTLYVQVLKSLTRVYYYDGKRDTAAIYGEKYLRSAQANQNLPEQAWAYNFLGLIHKNLGLMPQAIDHYLSSIRVKAQLNDQEGLSSTYNNMGILYQDIGDFTNAREYYEKSLTIKEQLGSDKDRLANSLNNFGELHLAMGLYDKAIEYYFKALKYYEETQNAWGQAATFNNIGIIHSEQKNHNKAIEYFDKSLFLSESNNFKDLLPKLYMNLGKVEQELGAYDKNIEYLKKGLAIEQANGNPNGVADMYLNLGVSLCDHGSTEEALAYLRQAREVFSSLKYGKDIANVDVEIARCMIKRKNYPAALAQLAGALKTAQNNHYLPVEAAALKALANASNLMGQYKQAYEYYTSYTLVQDSLDNVQKSKEIAEVQSRYDQEKDKAEIQKLYADQINKELKISEQKRNQNIIVGTSLLLLLTLSGMYLFLRLRQHRKQIQFEKLKTRQLQHIDQIKDQFLANTSHELRTPLNGIIGLADSLIDGVTGQLAPKTIHNLQLISSSGKRLSSLVNDILDFSKAKNKDLNLELKPVDPYVVADLVIQSSNILIGKRSILLQNKMPHDIPLIDADENRFQQILYNLIGNAIKFTDQGKITLTAEKKEKTILFNVSDTGIGIPNDKLDLIFKSFEQLDGTETRSYGGTGLGLAVTKQLVELHGGSIGVHSIPGEGSVFSFELPISQLHRDELVEHSETLMKINTIETEEAPPDLLTGEQTTSGTIESSASILIVDDEAVNIQVLENHLSLRGYQVHKAFNGQEALLKLQTQIYDLVILDVMMPNMSGFEVCKKIRETHLMNKLPVIMLTAKNTISDLLKGFEVGVNDYLTKPFSKDELLSRIHTHLRLKDFYKASDKFVPIEFLNAIGRNSITEAKIGDFTNGQFTIVFSDIRNYTGLAENLSPEQNFKFINGFVGRMGPIIKKHQGFVNQYLGDAIMSIFPAAVEFALDASIEMHHTIHDYNVDRSSKERASIEVGMGIHTGPLIMGIIGDQERADPATLADTVNIASRIEGLTKYFGVKILISHEVYLQLVDKNRYSFRSLGKIQLKGKSRSITVYECLDAERGDIYQAKLKTLELHNRAMKFFQDGEFAQASVIFQKMIDEYSKDSVARYFLTRSLKYLAMEEPINWTGVEIMAEK